MTDSERIVAIKSYCGLTWAALAKRIGIGSQQTFIDIKNGKIGISSNVKQRLLQSFPEFNPMWFSGMSDEMLIPSVLPTANGNTSIPVLSGTNQASMNLMSLFRNVDASLYVTKQEMTEYQNGSILLLRRIVNPSALLNERNYYISTHDFAVVRRLDSFKDNTFFLSSDMEGIGSMQININNIIAVYAVVGSVELQDSQAICLA